MKSIGGITILDNLKIAIGDESVQLRPAQGLRLVERLLRASTRRIVTEEAEKPDVRRPLRKAAAKL